MGKTKDVTVSLTIGAGKTCYPCRLSRQGMCTVLMCRLFDETCVQAVDGQVITYERCPGCIKEFGIEEGG